MKRFGSWVVMVFVAMALATSTAWAKGSRGGRHYSNQGGHYSSGKGRSHKGGSYKNKRTGDRYTKH